jgi:hypothetical protein
MIFFITFLLLFISVPSFGETVHESPSQVWQVGDRRWTVDEELQFGRWVEENISEDFFVRHRIAVDCADVPYAVRWIYARIAHLPAAATTKENRLIGHWSTEWGRFPTHADWDKDQRFRAALRFMLTETTTRTLPLDTYPIRIAPDSITPGTPFFVTESHSGIVGRVVLDGSYGHPLQTWEATVPAKTQKLSERDFLAPRPESTTFSGLVKFRWPVIQNGKWKYLPPKEHPFYSEEQYSSEFYQDYSDFAEAVAKRIDPTEHDPKEKMEKVMDTITRYLQERIPIVQGGYKRCNRGGCPEGSALWEIHSTPGRDGTIMMLMDHLHRLIESDSSDKETIKEMMEEILFPISPEQSITFYHLYQNYAWLSFRPEDPIEARWGLRKCEMISAQIRSAKTSISFIEKTYRKKDPPYADFAVGQQQELIRKLGEEWGRSECKEEGIPPKEEKKETVKRNRRQGR